MKQTKTHKIPLLFRYCFISNMTTAVLESVSLKPLTNFISKSFCIENNRIKLRFIPCIIRYNISYKYLSSRDRVDTRTKCYCLSDVLERNLISGSALHRLFYRKSWWQRIKTHRLRFINNRASYRGDPTGIRSDGPTKFHQW